MQASAMGAATNAAPTLSGRMLSSGFQLEINGGTGSYTIQSSTDPGFRDPQIVTNFQAGTNTLHFFDARVAQGSRYYRIVTNAWGGASNQPPVPNHAPVIVTQPKSTNAVLGSAVTFSVTATGTAPLSYQWYKDSQSNAIAGATGANYVISSVSSNNIGQYFVRVSNLVGSVLSSNAMLTIAAGTNQPPVPNQAPVIVTQPKNTNAVLGGTASFSVTATGTAPLSYQWYKGSQSNAIAGATSANYVISSVSSNNVGVYFVRVANLMGSVLSSNATLTISGGTNQPPVNQAPAILTQPKSTNAALGSTVTFSVTATGTAPLSYQWFKDSQSNAIAGATSANYVISPVSSNSVGSYFVRVSNLAGSVLSSNAVLTLSGGTNQPPVNQAPAILSQPKSTNAALGSTVTFSVTATGTAPLSYQWFKDSQSNAIAGATSANYVISSVSSNNVGSYFVRVSNPAGSVLSSNAALTVFVGTNQPPSPVTNPPVIIYQPMSTNAVAGSKVTFQVSATGSALSYQWFKDDLSHSIFRATNASYVINSVGVTNAGLYFVQVANPAGSVTSSNAVLTVIGP